MTVRAARPTPTVAQKPMGQLVIGPFPFFWPWRDLERLAGIPTPRRRRRDHWQQLELPIDDGSQTK